jgi:hypothetical protein
VSPKTRTKPRRPAVHRYADGRVIRYLRGQEVSKPSTTAPTPAEINQRSAKRIRYRQRLAERALGAARGPIEVTPEIERELNTPVNELPVDQNLRGALRRAGASTGERSDYLAHIRLAKMRKAKRASAHKSRVEGGRLTQQKLRDRNADRDRRIHKLRDEGLPLEAIAAAEGCDISTVSRVLKKTHP